MFVLEVIYWSAQGDWYYEFVLNVKIIGMDIIFNEDFLFEVFKEYWSNLLLQQCVLSLLEIL